jgi:hypothetical protein
MRQRTTPTRDNSRNWRWVFKSAHPHTRVKRTPGSMHVCLSVDEVLRLIACELVESRAKTAAVALACSCKRFEVPALDALWRTQEHLPLLALKSLPGDIWNGDGRTVSMQTTCVFFFLNYLDRKSFKRLPTTPEWARSRKYARRM